MIGIFLVVQVPDTGDEGAVSLLLRPINSFLLSPKCPEYVVGVIFDYIIINVCAFGATLRASFYVDVGHYYLLNKRLRKKPYTAIVAARNLYFFGLRYWTDSPYHVIRRAARWQLQRKCASG
jgi:hypothetical protein